MRSSNRATRVPLRIEDSMHNIRSQKEKKIDNHNSLNVGIDVNVECSFKNANKKDDFVNNDNSNGKMYKKETNCCNDGTNKIEIDKSKEVNESSMKDPIKRAENENNRMTDNKVQGDKLIIMKTRVPGQEGAKGNAAERYRVACEEISKWKAGLKEDMDVRSDVCKAKIWVTKGLLIKEKGNVLGLVIIRDQSEGHFILSLKDSRSGDCDVEKNALSTTEAGYTTNDIWLKGFLTESVYELRLVACIATGALVKGGSRFKVRAQVKVAAY
nr:hypothetical protein [Tanacetum cinerariifolium]